MTRRSSLQRGVVLQVGLLAGGPPHLDAPVRIRKAPNRYRIQWNWASSQPPIRIITLRSTMAPMMPIISTRFW